MGYPRGAIPSIKKSGQTLSNQDRKEACEFREKVFGNKTTRNRKEDVATKQDVELMFDAKKTLPKNNAAFANSGKTTPPVRKKVCDDLKNKFTKYNKHMDQNEKKAWITVATGFVPNNVNEFLRKGCPAKQLKKPSLKN